MYQDVISHNRIGMLTFAVSTVKSRTNGKQRPFIYELFKNCYEVAQDSYS